MADFGYTSIGGSTTSGQSSVFSRLANFTTTGQQLDSVSIYAALTDNVRIGLYYSASLTTNPASYSLIEDFGSVAANGGSAGWITVNSATNPSLSTGYYAICAEHDGTGGTRVWYYQASVVENALTFHHTVTDGAQSTAMPDPPSTGTNAGGLSLSMYFTHSTADSTAPVLSSPTDTSTGSTTGSGSVSTDEGNGTLYWVVTTSATSPSAAQVKAGQDHTGSAAVDSGSQAVSGTGVQNVSGGFTGLTASTTYYAHYMHEDAATNQSTVSSADGFTTSAAGTALPVILQLILGG